MLFVTSVFMLTHSTSIHSTKSQVNISVDEIRSFKSIKDKELHQSQSNTTNIQRTYPLFILDLLYGWPIDPRNRYVIGDVSVRNWSMSTQNNTEELHKWRSALNHSQEADLDKQLWWNYLSAVVGVCVVSASLQLVIRSTNNNIIKVVFFQGFGVLVYTLAGNCKIFFGETNNTEV